jgi:preprotein translocase SecE subunit
MQRLKLFIQESRQEFKRVNWPTYKETTRLTIIVIFMSLLTAAFLGVFDMLFLYGLDSLLLR